MVAYQFKVNSLDVVLLGSELLLNTYKRVYTHLQLHGKFHWHMHFGFLNCMFNFLHELCFERKTSARWHLQIASLSSRIEQLLQVCRKRLWPCCPPPVWTHFSKFAFASSYVPGSGDDSEFVKMVKNVLGRDATLSELASFRKLLHEAYSLVTQEMKQQLERSEDVHARKLTQPERADLYERQVKRITGLTLRGPLEPSDALVDAFCAMYESNRIRFVAWEKYTARDAELDKEAKPEHLFALDSSGKLKVEGKKSDPIADTSSEILLQYALQRRGLSMNLVSTSCGLTVC